MAIRPRFAKALLTATVATALAGALKIAATLPVAAVLFPAAAAPKLVPEPIVVLIPNPAIRNAVLLMAAGAAGATGVLVQPLAVAEPKREPEPAPTRLPLAAAPVVLVL